MALDTDIKNPDSHLIKTFYAKECINEFETEKKLKETGDTEPVTYIADYLKIDIPGNKDLVINTPVREEHKKRFPMEWAAYQNRGDAKGFVSGTPIELWPRVANSPGMAEELRSIKFSTIQAVAGASDAQLQSIGMIAGQSSFTFRDDAKRYLATMEATSKLTEADKKSKEADEKLAAANAELARQQEQHAKDMEEMRAQMKQLMEMATSTAQESRKPGRPTKEG